MHAAAAAATTTVPPRPPPAGYENNNNKKRRSHHATRMGTAVCRGRQISARCLSWGLWSVQEKRRIVRAQCVLCLIAGRPGGQLCQLLLAWW
jgi:hypothetical protein